MTAIQSSRWKTFWQIFGWPVVIGILSIVGLLSALLGDGIWDGLSWVMLAIPIVLYGFFLGRGG